MKITQEKLEKSQIGLEIEITQESTREKYEQVIKDLMRNVNIPGFRKGKVSRQILLQRIGTNRVKASVLEELIPEAIEQAVKQEDIKAIGQPKLVSSFDDLIGKYKPGETLTFSAAVDVEPEVNIKQYTGMQIKAEEVKYDSSQVDRAIEEEREKIATLVPVEGRAAQLGDVALVDFHGVLTEDPKPIPGAEGEDFSVDLNEDRFIPGFVSGIVGMIPGETREIPAQFPDNYPNEELANKAALFTVTLKEIKERELPELDDNFAEEVSDFKTLAELIASLEKQFQQKVEEKNTENKHQALFQELLQHVEIDLPETMIEQQVDHKLEKTAFNLAQQGLDVRKLLTRETVIQFRENIRPSAIEDLKRDLAIREIAKRESITVDKEEVEKKAAEMLQQYSSEDIDVKNLNLVLEIELEREKVLDWLIANSSLELVPEGSLSGGDQEPETTTPE
ncbi:trigger factor [Cylindrospermopsis raciborskii]|uniref:trigger factor n=2 Tax=Cylindrospermopsis raciborskii TaxID=77022 RepID=UPI0022BE47C3|nr:trigger factor [Cylindrospermopsis raciborskii]MCZ2205679.1 trigger factor [Cylindrospermopsis raciborskii PAMP2011]